MIAIHICGYLLLQLVANLLFKWGSSGSGCYWMGFILGNVIGVGSIVFMIGIYKALPTATAIAIGTGGVFLVNQMVMYLIYHESLSSWALCGLLMIFCGILMTSLLNTPVKI